MDIVCSHRASIPDQMFLMALVSRPNNAINADTETYKDHRCTINCYGEVIEKAAIEAVYDLMLERRPPLNNLQNG